MCQAYTEVQKNMWARLRDSCPCTHIIHATYPMYFPAFHTAQIKSKHNCSTRTHARASSSLLSFSVSERSRKWAMNEWRETAMGQIIRHRRFPFFAFPFVSPPGDVQIEIIGESRDTVLRHISGSISGTLVKHNSESKQSLRGRLLAQ